MGDYIRDFRGNELERLEREEASDNLVGRLDDYISEWMDKTQDLYDLAANAQELVNELEDLRDKKQAELYALEEEEEEIVEDEEPIEGTLAYWYNEKS
jgi:hypothetical protein